MHVLNGEDWPEFIRRFEEVSGGKLTATVTPSPPRGSGPPHARLSRERHLHLPKLHCGPFMTSELVEFAEDIVVTVTEIESSLRPWVTA